MQSRMDKYNTNNVAIKSRTEKNRDLYEEVKNSSLRDFDVNSNVQLIENSSDVIDVGHVRQILDSRYRENAPKRKSIDIPIFEETIEPEEIMDTKEYDINAIINKAKQGKNVDYSKERLKKIRETQFEILNNLELNKEIEEEKTQDKDAEQNLMDLINTITHIEKINKEKYSKEVSGAMDLLGLGDETEIEDESVTEEINDTSDVTLELQTEDEKTKKYDVTSELEKTKEEHITETLSKLDIDISSYDDFKDISKNDKASIFIKIIIFIIVLGLIVGAIYILNNLLGLGLFT